MTDRTAQTRPPTADAGATGEFERLYRANVDAVTAYFARRSADPQVVADLTADTFGLAAAATVAGLAVGGGSPAYALTTNSDGTITLAVYQASGIAQANAKLHQLGDDVVVVPIRPGCPPPRPPAVSPKGKLVSLGVGRSRNGSITLTGHAPAGDIIVVGVEITPDGGRTVAQVSSLPAPACMSPPPPGSESNG